MSDFRIRQQLLLAADAQTLRSDKPDGSFYIYALAVAYLSAPDEGDSEHATTLSLLFQEQARLESVNDDEIMNWLLMNSSPD